MIKLIECKEITRSDSPKKALMLALLEGRRFSVNPLALGEPHSVIHWDASNGYSPVRCGSKPWNFRGFKYLHEITESHWYDNIPEEGVLCWVSNSSSTDEFTPDLIIKKGSGNIGSRMFTNTKGIHWGFAKPISEAALYKEPV